MCSVPLAPAGEVQMVESGQGCWSCLYPVVTVERELVRPQLRAAASPVPIFLFKVFCCFPFVFNEVYKCVIGYSFVHLSTVPVESKGRCCLPTKIELCVVVGLLTRVLGTQALCENSKYS